MKPQALLVLAIGAVVCFNPVAVEADPAGGAGGKAPKYLRMAPARGKAYASALSSAPHQPIGTRSPVQSVAPPLLGLPIVRHTNLDLVVVPSTHVLKGKARLTLERGKAESSSLRLVLGRGFTVTRVAIDGRAVHFMRAGEGLEIPLPRASRKNSKAVVAIDYAGRPTLASATGRLQDLGQEGLVLHPTGRWFPEPAGGPPVPASVQVKFPAGWRLATPPSHPVGKSLHFAYGANAPRVLIAGPYRVFNTLGKKVFARPRPDSEGVAAEVATIATLAEIYRGQGLDLALTPIRAARPQSELVIELAPGYAPLGGPGWVATARPPGSLGTWLAQLAWLPDRRPGTVRPGHPWLVESLAAFGEEWVLERREGHSAYEQALAAHRASFQEFLRTSPEQDRALLDAIPAQHPAWSPVVQHKGVLIWAMLRDELGEQVFWRLLRRFQARLQAGGGTLDEFWALAGRRGEFVSSWLSEKGLPAVVVEDPRVVHRDGVYQVTGALNQAVTRFRFPLELALVTADGVERLSFQTFSARVPFHFVGRSRPLRLVVDPAERRPLARHHHLLIPEGLASPDALIVYGTAGTPAENAACFEAASTLQARLAHFKQISLPMRADTALLPAERRRSLILFGRPGVNALATAWADQFPVRFIEGRALWWQGRTFTRPRQGTVQTIPNPEEPARTVLLFAANSAAGMADALRFTQQSATFCLFEGDRLLEEGRAMRTFPDLDAVLF